MLTKCSGDPMGAQPLLSRVTLSFDPLDHKINPLRGFLRIMSTKFGDHRFKIVFDIFCSITSYTVKQTVADGWYTVISTLYSDYSDEGSSLANCNVEVV